MKSGAGRRVPLGRIPPGQPPGQVQDRTSSPAGKLSGGNLSANHYGQDKFFKQGHLGMCVRSDIRNYYGGLPNAVFGISAMFWGHCVIGQSEKKLLVATGGTFR